LPATTPTSISGAGETEFGIWNARGGLLWNDSDDRSTSGFSSSVSATSSFAGLVTMSNAGSDGTAGAGAGAGAITADFLLIRRFTTC
jgi:hypothetical protein